MLDISQSTLTRRIQLLEHRTGIVLFERSRRGTRLTIAGKGFLDVAVPSAQQLDRAVKSAASLHRGERGELRIGILASLSFGFLHSVLREFRRRYPKVRLRVHEDTSDSNLAKLMNGQIDISFAAGTSVNSGNCAELKWREKILIAIPHDHRLAPIKDISWYSIRDEIFIVSDEGRGPEIHDYLLGKLSKPGFRPRIDIHRVGCEGLMSIVALGYGITLTTTSSLISEVGGVTFRPISGDGEQLTSSAFWLPNNPNTALKHFLQVVKMVAQEFGGMDGEYPTS